VTVSTDDCVRWTGTIRPDGYGVLVVDGRQWLAHRWAYTTEAGPIPEGLVIDHLCRNRSCVFIPHLDVTTIGENVLRGDTLPAANLKKTRCPQGHPYDEDNTYTDPRGHRHCRVCGRARCLTYNRRKREGGEQSCAL